MLVWDIHVLENEKYRTVKNAPSLSAVKLDLNKTPPELVTLKGDVL